MAHVPTNIQPQGTRETENSLGEGLGWEAVFIDPAFGKGGRPEGGWTCSRAEHSLTVPLPSPCPSPAPCDLTASFGNPPLQAPSAHTSHLNPISLPFSRAG